MTAKLSSRIMRLLSLLYGGVIAVLAILGSNALTLVAVIGALAIGILWAVRGMLISDDRSRQRES
jgi:Flp pilus assembly protein TadB